ncbi:MAG: potassium-transporting ATPase subunit KdpC [Myxococcota bacterium]
MFTLSTGLLYPAVVTGVAAAVFPAKPAGSLVYDGDAVFGSALIGRRFDGPGDFWGRPSAAAGYDATASGGSNLGPRNPALAARVAGTVGALAAAGPVPVDLATASGSGVDPHVSPAAAYLQVDRVAAARGLDPAVVRAIVDGLVEGRTFGVLGEPRVSVLALNRAVRVAMP